MTADRDVGADRAAVRPATAAGRAGVTTEAGARVYDFAHGFTRLNKPEQRDKARDLLRAEVPRIEAEARQQGAAAEREGILAAVEGIPVGAFSRTAVLDAILDAEPEAG